MGKEMLEMNATSAKLDQLNEILDYVLPTVCGLILPLCLTNGIVLLNLGLTKSPSSFIYFNIILMDALNALTGVLIYTDAESKHWKGEESSIYLLTFDAEIFLIFGLSLIRCFCLQMSAVRILSNLQTIAYVIGGLAWVFGVFSVTYPCILGKYTKVSYVDFMWMDILECLLIVATITLSVYTWCAIRRRCSLLSTSAYKSASNTSLLITLNFVASYTYYVFLNSARIYYTLNGLDCPKDTWMEVFVCQDSLYVGVTFMCIQSLTNNLILLWQGQTKRFLVGHWIMCVRDIRRKIRNFGEDTDYYYYE